MDSGFSKRLRFALNGSKINQRELARQTGVSAQAVTKWLAGGAPATAKIKRIAEALEVDPNWLLFGDEAEGAKAGNVRALLAQNPKLAAAVFAGTTSRKVALTLAGLLKNTERVGYSQRADGKVVGCNLAFAEMVAADLKDVVGARLDSLVPVEHADRLAARAGQVIEAGEVSVDVDRLGSRLVAEVTIPDGQSVQVLTFDITEEVEVVS